MEMKLIAKIKNFVQRALQRVQLAYQTAKWAYQVTKRDLQLQFRQFAQNNRAFVDVSMVTAIVAGFIALAIGLVIFWSVMSGITFPSEANTTPVTNMFNTVMGLLPIVMLVGVAGLIIAVLKGFGGRGK